MKYYNSGCILCGDDIVYFEKDTEMVCEFCNNKFLANCACENDHYICDACHSKKGFEEITNIALSVDSANPIEIASLMMNNPFVNIHGPEHHYLVPAALLAATKNTGYNLDLKESLSKALDRAKNVPGGICGFWGSCGASIGCGIYISILTNATPLSVEPWSYSNKIVSICLNQVSIHGGPRCCKRNSFISIIETSKFLKDTLSISLDCDDNILCKYFLKNKECIKNDCPYYPHKS